MSAARRRPSLADSMLTTLTGNAYPAVIALITGPIMAHALGVYGRGQVAAAAAPLSLVSTLVTFGIPEAVTFAVAANPRLARAAAKRASAILFATGAVGMALIWLASSWLSGGDATTTELVVLASMAVIPTLFIGLLRGLASAAQQWRMVALERGSAATIRLIVILSLWIAGALTPLSATIVLSVMPILGAAIYIGLPRAMRSRYAPDPVSDDTPARTGGLLSYGGRIWLGSISGILLSRIDQTLMTALSGSYALGLYAIAVTVSELPLIINSAVRDVTFATDAARPDDSRLTASARVSFLACIVAGVLIGCTMPFWIPWLFGADFAEAVPVAAVLIAAVVLGTPGSIGSAGLSARGRPGLRSISLLLAAVVNLVLLLILTPPLGAMGAAIATFVGNVTAANANILFLKRIAGTRVRDFYLIRGSDFRLLRDFASRKLRRRRS
ncbi:oligosaccharide flippase family protein [uncultured Microbacterium sp.]|uniref:Polysaccharide biosynthesis protein n=1 Tax=uncultured Microbacterium sp. TaxID=191216 RepID=A0A1Y5NXM0_9MICO|nr:oligosaccharide flippase family protein [uncultured Microbacterium sp.]SBS71227.1 Polysaccharide biosynthesis protein [uncultured Microbacterium sp.]